MFRCTWPLAYYGKRLQQRKKKRLQSPQGFGWSPKWWLVWGMFPPNGCSSQTDCSRKCRPITIWCSSYYQVMPLKIPVRGDKFAINHFFGVNFCKIIWYKLLHHIAIEEKTHLIVPLKKNKPCKMLLHDPWSALQLEAPLSWMLASKLYHPTAAHNNLSFRSWPRRTWTPPANAILKLEIISDSFQT